MKSFATLITACMLAGWVGAIAVIAVQNATPVSLRLLNFQTFEMPFGLVLAFGVMLGVLGTAIAQPLLGFVSSPNDNDDV